MYPNGWRLINLGNLAKISSGSTPSRGVVEYWDGTIPCTTTGEINYTDIYDTREKITDKALAATSLKTLLPGTILLAMIGQGATRGRVARLKISATTNQNCCAIVAGKEVCSDYLYFYLEDQYQEIRDLSNAGGQQSLNADLIRNIMIPLPPLPEQRKIADILGTWDEAIALTTRLIAAKGQRKRGLMQQLLAGKRRFQKLGDTTWAIHKLSDIAEVDARYISNNTESDFTFRYISLSDVNKGNVSTNLPLLKFGQAPVRARKLVRNQDILLSTVRPNLQGFGMISDLAEQYVVSTGFAVISVKQGYSPQFVYQYLFSDQLMTQLNALVVGSNYPSINSSDVGNLQIICPPYEEQKHIAELFRLCDEELRLLARKLALLKQQKGGLMQQLLTGKVRVTP